MFDTHHTPRRGPEIPDVVPLGGSVMDVGYGERVYFTRTATAAATWAFQGVPAIGAVVVILELTKLGTATQTWPSVVKWPGGTAPTLTSSGVGVLGFLTDDGGVNWCGVVLMTDSK